MSSPPFFGEIEVDESYFEARRIKGKRCHGAYGKTPVFGILQRGGKVESLTAIFTPMPGAVTVVWLTWDTKSHYRVHHGNDQFANGKRHINGIESF